MKITYVHKVDAYSVGRGYLDSMNAGRLHICDIGIEASTTACGTGVSDDHGNYLLKHTPTNANARKAKETQAKHVKLVDWPK